MTVGGRVDGIFAPFPPAAIAALPGSADFPRRLPRSERERVAGPLQRVAVARLRRNSKGRPLERGPVREGEIEHLDGDGDGLGERRGAALEQKWIADPEHALRGNG